MWEAIERRQPGLFAQMVTVPLFHEHRILTQVAGHHMNVIKALPPLTISEEDLRRFAAALEACSPTQVRMFRGYAGLGLRSGAAAYGRPDRPRGGFHRLTGQLLRSHDSRIFIDAGRCRARGVAQLSAEPRGDSASAGRQLLAARDDDASSRFSSTWPSRQTGNLRCGSRSGRG